jgi:hypothetical protein
MDLLVNATGTYDGYRPLDFFDDEATASFSVEAGGPWTIEILPFEYVYDDHFLVVPGTYEGMGDDIFFLACEDPDLAVIEAGNGSDNFVVWSIGSSSPDLLVNEVTPYEGTFFVPGDLGALIVEALGPWSIEITRRSDPYEETFDRIGNWGSGTSEDVDGQVHNGVYEMLVISNSGLYFATAGDCFSDGIYEVDATQISGPLNNGYGMLFMVDEITDSFYVFEVSGDGWIWIGRCTDLCELEQIALAGGDWFRSPAVNQGLQATNNLRVVVDGPEMTFYVNGVEVGRTSDDDLTEGDIAVMVETLGEGGVRVNFDNFKFTPQ